MAKRRAQIIVLRVEWEQGEDETAPAAEWNWGELAGEDVVVMAQGPLVEFEVEDDDDALAAQQDECEHDFKQVGYNPEFGPIYECTKCQGVTP